MIALPVKSKKQNIGNEFILFHVNAIKVQINKKIEKYCIFTDPIKYPFHLCTHSAKYLERQFPSSMNSKCISASFGPDELDPLIQFSTYQNFVSFYNSAEGSNDQLYYPTNGLKWRSSIPAWSASLVL
jgi:hypothetical protein